MSEVVKVRRSLIRGDERSNDMPIMTDVAGFFDTRWFPEYMKSPWNFGNDTSISNGSALPSWLTFNPTTRKFSGTPQSANLGTITINVSATDGDNTVTDVFTLTVANSFYRAIDLNGTATTIDGNAWEAGTGIPNASIVGATYANQSIALIPPTDANRSNMIRSVIYNNPTVNITSVPNGIYDIYIYLWEDNFPTTFSLVVEGTTIISNGTSGNGGEWKRVGPIRKTVNDGAITASTTGEAGFAGIEVRRASTGEVNYTLTSSPQTIQIAAGQSQRITTQVSPNDGTTQTVSWSSSNTAIATVDATGLVRAVAAGTATITAGLAGGATATTALTVLGAGANTVFNGEFDNGFTGWSITDFAGTPPNSATVVHNAGLSGANALYVDIANTNPDNWTYQVRTALPFRAELGRTYRISFMAKAQATRDLSVSLWGNLTSANYVFNTFSIGTTGQTYSATTTISNSGISSESQFSLAFYTSIGALNDLWIDKVVVEDVTGITQVSSVSVSPASTTLAVGATAQLTKTIAPSNASNQNVIWTSGNPSVATVSAAGLVTAVAPGSATITVQTENGAKLATATVTVSNIAVTGVSISPSVVNIPAGNTVRLAKVIQPSNATNQNATWASANQAIATVDANGTVTAVAAGFTTITATTASGGFVGTATINVLPAATDFIVNGEFDSGSTHWQLTDNTTPTGANISVVTNAAMSGANALRVDVQNINSQESTLQLAQALGRKIELGHTYRISFLGKAETNRAVKLAMVGTSATSYVLNTFNLTTSSQVYSLDYVCNQSGVTAESGFVFKFYLAMGVITDVWLDDIRMVDITPPVAVTGVTLSPSIVSVIVGGTAQLTPTLSPANATNRTVSWSTSNASVASVSPSGLVTAAGVGSATITATTANGNFTATTSVTVASATATSLADVVERFAFQYKYDGRKRMTQKKVPGADWVYMVYDDRDRLVMTQDGNQREKSPREWTFTKYDVLNRPVLTGIYKDSESSTLDIMQVRVNDFYAALGSPGNSNAWYESAGTIVHQYTNNSFPKVTMRATTSP